MENYETLGVLGEGTYGVVIKARHRTTGQLVAIKKFKQAEDDDHVRKTSLREVKVLKQLHHPNVVSLVEVFRREGKLYLVFEYIENTILQLLEVTTDGLQPLEVKKFMYQLLRGVDYCHAHSVIHRDVKPENILVSRDGLLKVCDFGFARHTTAKGKYTDYVATRWYRAPELLVGDVAYGKGVDIWAIGCILAELSDSQPLFPGDSDLDQLAMILRTCGPVPDHMVKTFERNPLYRRVPFPHSSRGIHRSLQQRYPRQSPEWMEFLAACLRTDPEERPSCAELMSLPYFTNDNFRAEYERELQALTIAAAPWFYANGGNTHATTNTNVSLSPSMTSLVATPQPESPDKSSSKTKKKATTAHPSTSSDVTETGRKDEASTGLPDISGSPPPATVAAPPAPPEPVKPLATSTNSNAAVSALATKEDKPPASNAINPIAMNGKSCLDTSFGHQRSAAAAAGDTSDATAGAGSGATTGTAQANGGGPPLPNLGVLWSQYLGGTPANTVSAPAPAATTALPLINQGGANPSPAAPGTNSTAAAGMGNAVLGASYGKHKPSYAATTTPTPAPTHQHLPGALTVPSPSKADGRRTSLSVVAAPDTGLSLSPRANRKARDPPSPSKCPTPTAKAKAAGGKRESRLQILSVAPLAAPKEGSDLKLLSEEKDGITSDSTMSSPAASAALHGNASGNGTAPQHATEVPDSPTSRSAATPAPTLSSGAVSPTKRTRGTPPIKAARNGSAKRAVAALQALSAFRSGNGTVAGRHNTNRDEDIAAALPTVGLGERDLRRSPSLQSQSTVSSIPRRAAGGGAAKSKRKAGSKGTDNAIGANYKPIAFKQKKKRHDGGESLGNAEKAGDHNENGLVSSTSSPQPGTGAGGHGRVSNPLQPRQPTLRQNTYNFVSPSSINTSLNQDTGAGNKSGVGSYGGYVYYQQQQGSSNAFSSSKYSTKKQQHATNSSSGNGNPNETANAGYYYGKNTHSMKRNNSNNGYDSSTDGVTASSYRLEELLASKSSGAGAGSLPQLSLSRN